MNMEDASGDNLMAKAERVKILRRLILEFEQELQAAEKEGLDLKHDFLQAIDQTKIAKVHDYIQKIIT
jgi:hypothetical protein